MGKSERVNIPQLNTPVDEFILFVTNHPPKDHYYMGICDIYVTQVLDFVSGIVVALKLFPEVLNFLFAPIEKKK